jgi:multiple sugar transport system substrate-binding protein
MYLDQWPNAVKVETNIPASEAAVAALPGGGKTWAGAFTIGVAKTTKYPEESWQFLKFITGQQAQRKFAEGGGSTARLSILKDKEFYSANRAQIGHFPVLSDILEDAAKHWYTNFIMIPQSAKIYEEAPSWLSAAASGEMTTEEAMSGFAQAIDEMTDGKASINNEGFQKPTDTTPYVFDKSLQVRTQ